MDEIWQSIPGFSKYEASNKGRIRNIRTERIRKPFSDRSGYFALRLSGDSGPRTLKIHRIIAITLISNPDEKPQVHHKDEDKTNNNVDNLEWVTLAQNIKYYQERPRPKKRRGKHGPGADRQLGEKNGQSKLTEKQVLWIRKLSVAGFSQCHLSEIFNISRCQVRNILSRHNWSHI